MCSYKNVGGIQICRYVKLHLYGKGKMRLGSGDFEGSYSFASCFENAPGTNPEELLGAAHTGCFSMALSLFLEQAGYTSESIHTVISPALRYFISKWLKIANALLRLP
jgi:organic hydroperoxide reductase OsmC/OhrA